MLLNLRIRDFAIIDQAEVEFSTGFTVVTGETGAGKSILVDALMLALGARANNEVVRTGADTARVEALFDIKEHPVVRARLEQRELIGDDPALLLISRVIGKKGRNKVLINGHLSTVATLSEIVRGLVDISGQHEQQSLLMTDTHLEILDAYSEIDGLKSRYSKAYESYRRLLKEYAGLQAREDADGQQVDFLRFQLDEIERVHPVEGEDETLELEQLKLANAEKLQGAASLAENLLYSENGSAFDKLGKSIAEVESIAEIDDTLLSSIEVLEGARTEIEEVARTLSHYGHRIEVDPLRLEEVEERQAAIRRLCKKYGGAVEVVLERKLAMEAELRSMDSSEERLSAMEAEVEALKATALKEASKLTKARNKAATKLRKAIEAELSDMELAQAQFLPTIRPREVVGQLDNPAQRLGPTGADEVEFLWSANPGETPRGLAKIASGGELSRVMLAVKRVLCSHDLVSLYVFDEVDTGLGGKAADSIGRKIQAVAKGHQAITITHLAPIAARADHHLVVTKHAIGKRTVSQIELQGVDGRAEEIARMIDGAEITRATKLAAKKMLERATTESAAG